MNELFQNPVSIIALVGVLALILFIIKVRKESISTRALVFAAIMLALATILQHVSIFRMPQGGTVTLGAMVPLLLVSYRYGTGMGLLTGFLFGIIAMILDPFILHPVQVLFDYPLPYMAMGLAGLWREKLYLGTIVSFFTRFLCHVLSGVVFFASYAPEGTSPLMYSLIFNATYLLPDCIICAVIIKLLPVKRIFNAIR